MLAKSHCKILLEKVEEEYAEGMNEVKEREIAKIIKNRERN